MYFRKTHNVKIVLVIHISIVYITESDLSNDIEKGSGLHPQETDSVFSWKIANEVWDLKF